MSYKEFEDEAEQRMYARDSKGRFAKRTIEPIKPIIIEETKEKWGYNGNNDDSVLDVVADETLKHFNRRFIELQKALNPKKECRDAYEEAHRLLIASGGALAKVINKKTNRPFGFLVRIPSTTNPNVVFLRFTKYDPFNKNTYFQKLNAVVNTVINGERWLEKREERGEWIDDIPFEYHFKKANRFMIVDGGITVIQPLEDIYYVAGKNLNDVEREGYTLNGDMMEYINRFEKKAREYYKNNEKNKKFIALPFN